MKKVLFVCVCLFVVSLTAAAQQGQRRGGTPEENAKRTTEWMTTELNLSKKQVVLVDSINLVYTKAIAKLREDSPNADFASLREPMQKLEEKRVKAFEKVLTDEQLQAYKKRMEERRANRGGNRRSN